MSALRFRIDLLGSYVPVSRTLVIPGDFTFRDLEAAIVEVFEFEGSSRSCFFLPRRDIALTDNLDPESEGITEYRIMDCGRPVRTYVGEDIRFMSGDVEMWMFALRFLGPDQKHKADYAVLEGHQGPSPDFRHRDPDEFYVFLRSYLDPDDDYHDEVVEEVGEEGIPQPDPESIYDRLRTITAGSAEPNIGW